ncbi:MAG: hypothetical protein FJZ87_12560 [Chloroflexi bacterium]|nr:hypothetical protein [Chloroflexota bacterium]
MNSGQSRIRCVAALAFLVVIALTVFACGAPLATPDEAPAQLDEPAVLETTLPPQPTQAFVPLPALPTATLSGGVAPGIIEPVIPPAIPEARRLTLEYPRRMRAGVEGDIVRLTLEVDDLGNLTPTAEFEGFIVTGEMVEIPDLYETHHVIAEARLDLAGMVVQPSDSTYEPLTRGQSVTFYWSITPQEPGTYRGIAWLHLNFQDRISGEESRIPLSAQIFEVETVDFFGLPVSLARTSGVIGSVAGGILGFPFLEDILKFLFGRRKK